MFSACKIFSTLASKNDSLDFLLLKKYEERIEEEKETKENFDIPTTDQTRNSLSRATSGCASVLYSKRYLYTRNKIKRLCINYITYTYIPFYLIYGYNKNMDSRQSEER